VDFHRIAARVLEARKKKRKPKSRKKKAPISQAPVTSQDADWQDTSADVSRPQTEFGCKVDISLMADFEGQADRSALVKKIKAELINGLKSSMAIVSRDLGVDCTNVSVQPLKLDIVVNDQADFDQS
jgi:hypothetical protein